MRILLGVTGCIAAYKACEILRELQRADADVRVVMTEAATRFVGAPTFAALSGHPVGLSLFDNATDPIPHIRLAEECDAFLIAPCTANVVAKLAGGIADDLLTSTALACTAPLMVAPAMNVHMYENAATQSNLATLRARGVQVLDPQSGRLACGEVGAGKLPEPSAIARAVLELAEPLAARALVGRHVLITSGPTVEPIDPVRFISNRSSGKMGAALAQAALDAGARVTVVSGPVSLLYPDGATVVSVETAREMLEQARRAASDADIIVGAAAVADHRPAVSAPQKLKKGTDDAELTAIPLVANPDVLRTLATDRRPGQIVVGFAAETDQVLAHAEMKLRYKHADMIVANEVGNGKAFGTDDDKAAFVTSAGIEELPLMPKAQLAQRIITKASDLLSETS
ncbi:bifunctional phosphopantothenoylcysteine decarboxylase/phosphopantothenate--cysteine ligase CoaBC [Adlercreutzia murintestinalis]|uniref:bifunctional phosphopantothenoylcysteine decarboxylase/phosphopantothenate--cysteine ligase CoaBC n=1 Tax=Adlercreutzia murintestinalis TaxID=2941325 RepID=UPI00203EEC87|nr:bifunctional phosphopantothenoylcysteine decarboxylase/phosphopantothenate--cysteine ligase CoaBC [Adlercreutzia murintestinalis]